MFHARRSVTLSLAYEIAGTAVPVCSQARQRPQSLAKNLCTSSVYRMGRNPRYTWYTENGPRSSNDTSRKAMIVVGDSSRHTRKRAHQ